MAVYVIDNTRSSRRNYTTPGDVTCGGGAQHLLGPEHQSVGNVVGGRELVPWLRSLEGAQIDKATAKQILAELEDHRRRVHPNSQVVDGRRGRERSVNFCELSMPLQVWSQSAHPLLDGS